MSVVFTGQELVLNLAQKLLPAGVNLFETVGKIVCILGFGILAGYAVRFIRMIFEWLLQESVPTLDIPLTELEAKTTVAGEDYTPPAQFPKDHIPCYDPGAMKYLGSMPAMTPEEVRAKVNKARDAQKTWATSSFNQRRKLLRIIQRYILDHSDTICRVSARDSGKPMVDAAFGEVLVTCEKIKWLLHNGEKYLVPERRDSGFMMLHKIATVEYHPVGVMGAIVPWNYPFHNVFNPLVANLFAGNAMVIKVSEYASWSVGYYSRIIEGALQAAGAPADLVQIVTGYGDAGHALVTGGVNKVVFVGSTAVGKMVAKAACDNLTPVVLELGGKDPFIVCDDADLNQLMPFAMRGTFQSMGQNCTGAERFIVQEGIYEAFVKRAVAETSGLRQGPALGDSFVDCGALCMPKHAVHLQALVDDAVDKGAEVAVGGKIPKDTVGQFYPPTVLTGVKPNMRLMQEEVFGPILPICKVATDEEAVALANDCSFGLGSSVFSKNQKRALLMGDQLQAGMTSINDFAATYMSQSLPFGGVKDSGYDRFAGIEGLRGCCYPKAVCVDRFPAVMKTNIPPLLQYPVNELAFDFVTALCKLFYGLTVKDRLHALVTMAAVFVLPSSLKKNK